MRIMFFYKTYFKVQHMFKGLTKFLFSDIDKKIKFITLTAKQKINLTDIT